MARQFATAGRRVSASAIGVAGLTLLVAQTAVNVSNFGFHVVMSRMLGPAEYGALGALLAVLTALSVPAGAFETIVSARVAHQIEQGRQLDARPAWRRSLLMGVAGTLVMLAATPVVQSYLHFRSVWPWLWISVYCVPLALTVVPWGVVCGRRQFARAGLAALAAALTRITAAVVFIQLGWGISGAIAASVVGDSLRVLLLIRPAGLWRAAAVVLATRLRIQPGQAARGTVAFTGLWMLLGVDTVLARHFFAPAAAGQYAAAAVVARAAFFVAQAVCILAVPRFATADVERARRALRWTLAAAAGLGVVATATIGVLGPLLVPLVFGAKFRMDVVTLVLLCIGATELSVLWVAVQYQLARGLRACSAGWIGMALALAGAMIWHEDGTRLALVMVVTLGAAVAIAGRSLHGADRYPDRPSMRPTGPGPAEPAGVDLSVVVPFYNPGDALRPNMVNLLTVLRECGATFEVITVEDGCTDGSAASIADLDADQVRRLSLPRNQGKGAALRAGLSQARGAYIGFIDADGDLDPALWRPFVSLIQLYRPDVVIGSKVHPLSEVDPDVTLPRRMCSLGYRLLVRVLFPRLPVRDTQVGIKVFRRELLEDVLPRTVERRFAFDLELLVAAQRMGYRRILPAPVSLRARARSTVTAALVARTAWDTLALAWRVHLAGSYDPAAGGRPGMAAGGQMSAGPNGQIGTVVGGLGPLLQPAHVGEDAACVS